MCENAKSSGLNFSILEEKGGWIQQQGICCSWHSGWSISFLARKCPWLRECTKAHNWAPLWWLARSPFASHTQGASLNRNGEAGKLSRCAGNSVMLASGWSYGSSVPPGFYSLLFTQLSLSCQKLEVEYLGEWKWMVCKMRSLGSCSVCLALGNTALDVSLEGGVNKPGVESGRFLCQSWLLLVLS